MKRAPTPEVSTAGAHVLAVYEAWMKAQEDLTPASMRNYISDLRHFIAWYEQETSHTVGDDERTVFSPPAITTPIVIQYRAFLQQREQTSASINRALISLKRYFQWARSQQLMSSDPSAPITLAGEEPAPPRHLSDQEEQKLVAAVTRHGTLRDRTMLLLLLHTGLRANELCGLKRDQITLEKGGGHLCVIDQRHKTRYVPLDVTACKVLEDYLPSLPAQSPWVFLSEKTHEALSIRALGYIITKYADLAHLADLSARDLRHRFGYRMAETIPLHKLAQIMGHDSMETTRRYIIPMALPMSQIPAASLSASPRDLGQVQHAPILLPKLRPPRLPASLLSRQRLLARMEKGCQGRLTMLVAPAGFGKTTLVRQWIEVQSKGTQTAWLSLDPEDDDPIRFWYYVLTACKHFEGAVGGPALMQLSTEQSLFTLPFLKTILTSFLNEVAQQTSRCLLVLEDYHVITSSQIHESLAFVFDHLPATLHLVMLTRSEPPLPLARWRGKGDLEEIDASDLRFSSGEITSFLEQALSFPLSTEMLQPLEAHLEGWPTGLRLLTLALKGKSKRHEIEQVLLTFGGSHRYLLDYFLLEVLAAQPEALQVFLLQTSMLNRMTASLCDAVTGRDDSEHLLKEVERAGLFLQSLAGEEPWYRYHHLFAEAMQVQARRRLGEEALRLCLSRASAWYEQHEMFSEGIEAALQARGWTRAATMMERSLNVQNRSTIREHATLRRWLETLPDKIFEAHPALCVNYAAALLFTLEHHTPETMVLIEKLLTIAEHYYEHKGEWGKLGEALSCHAEVARWQGDIPRTISLAGRALELPPEPRTLWRGTSVMTVGVGALYAGRPEEARRMVLEEQALFETPLPGSGMRGTSFMLSEISLQQGKLRQAEQLYRHLLASANGNFAIQGQALLGIARLSYEWNHLAEVEQNVALVLALGNDHLDEFGRYFVEAGFFFPGRLLQARLQQVNGNLLQAQQLLQELLVLAQERQWPPLYREALTQQAELFLATGDLAAVERWQATCRQPGEYFYVIQQEREALIAARLLIAQGAIPEALHILEYWQKEAHAHRRIRSELEVRIILALAHAASQNSSRAKEALKEALTLAHEEGFQRPFLEKGEALAEVLRALFLDLREESLVSYARGLLRAFARSESSPQATSALLLDPLTQQEQRVLRLLATGRTNPEIAQDLVVSINTVKTQVQSIYRKLNVKSRWEAREAARRLDI